MTPQELNAMKLALEALIYASYEDIEYNEACAAKVLEARNALKESLAEHAMQEVQRLGQEIEQKPLAWPCLIDSADFSENTITLVMQCEDYKVSAGTHWLSTAPPKETT